MLKALLGIYQKTRMLIPMPVRRFLKSVYEKTGAKDSIVKEQVSQVYGFYSSSRIIKKGDLVFDIGANIGIYTMAFLMLGAKVVAVEPQPKCIQVLKKKFSGNENVAIVEKGVAQEQGELELFLSEGMAATTFSEDFKRLEETSYKGEYTGKIKVPITTMDALISEHGTPKYCKIDTEGFEAKVLEGLSKPIQHVSFEFHAQMLDEAKKCANRLCSLGNPSFNYIKCNSKSFMLQEWVSKDRLFEEIENGIKASQESEDILKDIGEIYAKFPEKQE